MKGYEFDYELDSAKAAYTPRCFEERLLLLDLKEKS